MISLKKSNFNSLQKISSLGIGLIIVFFVFIPLSCMNETAEYSFSYTIKNGRGGNETHYSTFYYLPNSSGTNTVSVNRWDTAPGFADKTTLIVLQEPTDGTILRIEGISGIGYSRAGNLPLIYKITESRVPKTILDTDYLFSPIPDRNAPPGGPPPFINHESIAYTRSPAPPPAPTPDIPDPIVAIDATSIIAFDTVDEDTTFYVIQLIFDSLADDGSLNVCLVEDIANSCSP